MLIVCIYGKCWLFTYISNCHLLPSITLFVIYGVYLHLLLLLLFMEYINILHILVIVKYLLISYLFQYMVNVGCLLSL